MRVVGVVRARLRRVNDDVRVKWVVGWLVLCVLGAGSAVLSSREVPPLGVPFSVAVEQHLVEEHPADKAERERLREDALREVFKRRADAVLKRDRAAFLADLDDTDEEFVKRQEQVFDSLGKLDFASWEYRVKDDSYSVGSIDWEPYDRFDDLALPVLTLHYQLKGFDKRPVVRRVVYTVVRDGERWLIANDRDLQATTTSGTDVRQDPWENGPITVAKTRTGIVIGHPDDADAIAGIQKEVESAVKHVSSYVGTKWGERTVVILPANHDELQYLLENPDVPFEFAAIARAESTALDDEFGGQFAGTRVVINPDNFSAGSSFNRLLIRHEITHVAMFERTGPLTPKWLVEGIAEWVGNAGSDLPPTRLAGALADLVEEEGVPQHLPLDSDFGILGEAGVGYNAGWLLCRYIETRYGRPALLRFYDAMGSRTGLDKPGEKLETALRSVLKTDEARLLRDWRPYVKASVGDVTTLLRAPGKPYREDDISRLDARSIGRAREVQEKALRDAGMERAAEGVWYQGSDSAPSKVVTTLAVVSRDLAGARKVTAAFEAMYRKYDSGTPIPNGRLYLVRVTINDKDYVDAVAVMTAGIVTYELAVSYEIYSGDPTAEARRLAAAQYAAALAA